MDGRNGAKDEGIGKNGGPVDQRQRYPRRASILNSVLITLPAATNPQSLIRNPFLYREKRIMHIAFSPKLGKISGAQHGAKIQCPPPVAKIGQPAIFIFA